MLQRLLRLPGAGYACLIDQISGEVATDLGTKRSSTTDVVAWAAAVAAFLSASGMDELDDVMITSRGSYHLVRRLAPAGERPRLVVLALDRGASNLAVARRELAAASVSVGTAAVAPPMSATAPSLVATAAVLALSPAEQDVETGPVPRTTTSRPSAPAVSAPAAGAV